MQTNLCLLVLFATALVVCVSAGDKPNCFKDPSEDEMKKGKECWVQCMKEAGEGKEKYKKAFECTMKKKNLVDEKGNMVKATIDSELKNKAKTEYCDALQKVVDTCYEEDPKADKYFVCNFKGMQKLDCEVRIPKKQ